MTTQDRIYNYFKRNPRLHVLFVFDPMGNLEAELHGLDWQDGYRYELLEGRACGTALPTDAITSWKPGVDAAVPVDGCPCRQYGLQGG